MGKGMGEMEKEGIWEGTNNTIGFLKTHMGTNYSRNILQCIHI